MDQWINKVAIITSADRTIGENIAVKLVMGGMKVIALGRDDRRLQATHDKLPDDVAKRFFFIKFGLGETLDDRVQIERVFNFIMRTYHRTHIFINIGERYQNELSQYPHMARSEIAEKRENFAANLNEIFNHILKLLQTHVDPGYVINLASYVAATTPMETVSENDSYYRHVDSMRKLTDTTRIQWAEHGYHRVKFAFVIPGVVDTDHRAGPEVPPPQRGISPDDVYNYIEHLLTLPPHLNITELALKSVGETF